MPNLTPAYNLVKPLVSEFYDVDVFNGNADIIDAALDRLREIIESLNLENKADLVDGAVPENQLPETVFEVVEGYKQDDNFFYDSACSQPVTAAKGKLYIDLYSGALYRWADGYIKIASPAEIIAAYEHAGKSARSAEGVHDLRYYEGTLQAQNEDGTWTVAAPKSQRVDMTLLTSRWYGTSYIIPAASLPGLTATCPVELLPGVGITATQLQALTAAMIVEEGSSRSSGLYLKALGDRPQVPIPVTFIIRGDL